MNSTFSAAAPMNTNASAALLPLLTLFARISLERGSRGQQHRALSAVPRSLRSAHSLELPVGLNVAGQCY